MLLIYKSLTFILELLDVKKKETQINESLLFYF